VEHRALRETIGNGDDREQPPRGGTCGEGHIGQQGVTDSGADRQDGREATDPDHHARRGHRWHRRDSGRGRVPVAWGARGRSRRDVVAEQHADSLPVRRFATKRSHRRRDLTGSRSDLCTFGKVCGVADNRLNTLKIGPCRPIHDRYGREKVARAVALRGGRRRDLGAGALARPGAGQHLHRRDR